jgi:hypothetical protein
MRPLQRACGAHGSSVGSAWALLRGEQLNRLDLWRLGRQLAGSLHEGSGNLAVEVDILQKLGAFLFFARLRVAGAPARISFR